MRDCEAELRARIGSQGAVTFAEFSEVALYWPQGGYYAGPGRIGPQGDFYTAPLTHPLFGALLAHQLQQQWRLMGAPHRFQVVELGAGSGRLARDLLAHARCLHPAFSTALDYLAVDLQAPSHPVAGVDWLQARGPALRGIRGCILANELLDALPVHRVVGQGGRLREIYVAVDSEGAFVEQVGAPSTPALEQRFADLGVRLPEGYRTEVNLGLEQWVRETATALDEGYLLVIDYGHEASILYDGSRGRGTLRCYYRHTLNANPYRRVGRQDISVHVDFTSLRRLAQAQGLKAVGYTTQSRFLTNLGLDSYVEALAQRGDLSSEVRRANLRAIATLVEPGGMGDFKVLALGKKVPDEPLDGFLDQGNSERRGLEQQEGVPVQAPLATADHMPVSSIWGTFGKFPQAPSNLHPGDTEGA